MQQQQHPALEGAKLALRHRFGNQMDRLTNYETDTLATYVAFQMEQLQFTGWFVVFMLGLGHPRYHARRIASFLPTLLEHRAP